MKRSTQIIFILAIVFSIFNCTKTKNLNTMTVEEAIKSNSVTLLDVREAIELEQEGAVEGAIHIPLGDISDNIEEIKAMPKPVVLFCRSGNRSGRAQDFLESEGIEGLYNGGGFKDVIAVLED